MGGATNKREIPASSSLAGVAEATPEAVDAAARSSEGASAVPLGLGLGGLQPKVSSALLQI